MGADIANVEYEGGDADDSPTVPPRGRLRPYCEQGSRINFEGRRRHPLGRWEAVQTCEQARLAFRGLDSLRKFCYDGLQEFAVL